jgi:ATP-dependent RNA helicase SUPV3L1/SUV3
MGLNLNISRIIFDTVEKFSGLIAPTHAKQIAGRAGRFGSDYAEGFVAAYDCVILTDFS